jgi:SNF2 family DNA or RNA helicase
MARLEDLTQGSVVAGVEPGRLVTVVQVEWVGSAAANVFYKDDAGRTGSSLLYRDAESDLRLERNGRAWSFDGDGRLLRLVSEAQRIQLAHLFDPLLAVHSSDVEPLPHQLTAVYEEMLVRQPLRFLLADDPGAGKTIMAGLFIKELWLRGDLRRCMIVCPGSLVEQWQDELQSKFDLRFEILTREKVEASASGNWFNEADLILCRLDQLSRNDDLQEKLKQTEWDLIVCDEAHKLSASYSGNEISYTGRYRLGQLLGELTRHFVLLSATPHNGKEADFQLFLALLDGDRFEGKVRSSAHTAKADDLMRRLVKEQLVRFDSTPLFPERRAYTVSFELSDLEAALYEEVTKYVRTEFDRADKLADNNRRGTVGFALTVLQRRLASSPEAIYQSLVRRHDRLKGRLDEERINRQAGDARLRQQAGQSPDHLDDIDEGLATDFEGEEDRLADSTTAALTLRELESEIATLARLIGLADEVRKSGTDRKWEELSSILQERIPQVEHDEAHRKLVIFTEHRDTLNYLHTRIANLLGRPEAITVITGGMTRDDRRKAQEAFTQDKGVEILIATDAAGEGINLQRAHLMVNYDLPWNPNRLEQRFGRIHRIGQREVCHLWNLIAHETREGQVYRALLVKLEQEREALGGKVFDVLGSIRFGEKQTLRDLLV